MINQNVKKGKQIRFEVKNRFLRPFCHRFDKKKKLLMPDSEKAQHLLKESRRR